MSTTVTQAFCCFTMRFSIKKSYLDKLIALLIKVILILVITFVKSENVWKV